MRLIPITYYDLPYIRNIRNKYRKYFIDKHYLNKDKQLKWWRVYKQNPDLKVYIIENDNKKIGMVTVKNLPCGIELCNIVIEQRGLFRQLLDRYNKPITFVVSITNNNMINIMHHINAIEQTKTSKCITFILGDSNDNCNTLHIQQT